MAFLADAAHNWRAILIVLIAFFLYGGLIGCANADYERLKAWSDFAYDTGMEVEINGTFGDGHFLGQSFNFSSLNGDFHFKGKPQRRSTDVIGAGTAP